MENHMTSTDLVASPAGTSVRTTSEMVDTSSIIGWGVDADPRNEPTYSYRDRSKDDHSGEWERPAQQEPLVEILQSVEHKQLPAVFGTSSPPRYVSGMIRRAAFRWSESNWAHWMLLMGADRLNMVEGLVEDLARGKVPNIPKEMGVPAEWRHNKTGLAKKIGVAALIGGGVFALVKARRRGRRSHVLEPRTGKSQNSEVPSPTNRQRQES
jgi:hypothetical protein